MKSMLIAAAGLLGVGLTLALTAPGLAQQLPTAPGMGSPAQPRTGVANQPWYTPPNTTPQPSLIAPWMNVPTEEANKDLLVKPEQGPWMILLISYVEQDDQDMAQVARALILELREKCGLPAYTFNYGLDERRKEIERMKDEIQKKHAELEAMRQGLGGNAGATIHNPGVRVKFTRYKVEYGVLIGGYASHDEAKAARERMKNLPSIKSLNPERYFQAVMLFKHEDKQEPAENNKMKNVGYVNPFENGKAMIVPNPSMPAKKVSDQEKLDVALLRRLNEEESYSLFKNTKPYTLAVKQYQLPPVTETKSVMTPVFQLIGLGGKERVDAAAESAHNLAEMLRRGGYEAYVLHTQFASIVTVGGFNGTEDPGIPNAQRALADLNQRIMNDSRLDPRMVGLFPVARPMQVPR